MAPHRAAVNDATMRSGRATTLLVALIGGSITALSVPPAGWWPLGVVGLGLIGHLLRGRSVRARGAIGFTAGLGLYSITLFWIGEFNAIGAVLVVLIEATLLAGAAAATPPSRGRNLGWVAAIVAQDWVRGSAPFGGLPLGGTALGQAAGPLAPAARLGGSLLVVGLAAATGVALDLVITGALATIRRSRTRRRHALPDGGDPSGGGRMLRPALAGGMTLVGTGGMILVGIGGLCTAGAHAGGDRSAQALSVAVVQGGGRRGLRAINGSAAVVLQAAFDASTAIQPPVDLVLWPEDVVALDGPVNGSAAGVRIGDVARRLHAPLLAGVTEDVGGDRFRNAQVVWDPDGQITGRYDKVHRVPFGEFVPGRAILSRLVSLDAIPRDAIEGHGTGTVDTAVGPVGIVISFEVFFSGRAREAIGHGGELLLAPTNTASYTTTQVPTSEIAAAKLRAWETGRDVVMAAPTGYSAVIDSHGRLLRRSSLGPRQVLMVSVHRRHGHTPYVRWGDGPVLLVAALAIGAAWGSRVLDRAVNSGKP
ncbi:MAG: apolipoprotein N-acyltransferase [Acidimicrobiales bacterium]